MFHLESEVAAWSEAVYAAGCRSAGSVAELSDHLYCEIDRARAEGLSPERAFAAAVAELGAGPELTAEDAKNRSLLATGCAVAARYERLGSSGERRGLLAAHAVLWAALMLASSLMLSKTAAPEALGWVLILVYLPLWWGSEQVLRRALRQRPVGGAR